MSLARLAATRLLRPFAWPTTLAPSPPPLMALCSAAASDLTGKNCAACEGGLPTLTADEVHTLLPAIPDWSLVQSDGPDAPPSYLRRLFRAKNFAKALAVCQALGDVAESEGHHPDLHLTSYNRLAVHISTHSVQGLTENDFILAAKIDALDLSPYLSKRPPSP
jgi:4a-hydroxytetrahydrobiopterin dehydratase